MLPIDRGGPAVEAAAALEKHGRRGFQSDRNLGGGDKKWWDTWTEGPVGFVDGLAVTRKWGGGRSRMVPVFLAERLDGQGSHCLILGNRRRGLVGRGRGV